MNKHSSSKLRNSAKLLIIASSQWLLTVTAYTLLGVLVSWLCYLFVAGPVLRTLPALPAARAGGIGALLALLVWMLYPGGYITALYLLGFPAGFFAFGQAQGVRAGVATLMKRKGVDMMSGFLDMLWPTVESLSQQEKLQNASDVLRQLVNGAGESRGNRRILRFLLSGARVHSLLASDDFMRLVREEPDKARRRIRAQLEARVADWTQSGRWKTLLILALVVIAFTSASGLWLPWIGAPR